VSPLPYRRGVGILLIDRRGYVFIAKRIDNPEPFWQMPQGGIDKDESPRDAALRELKEEAGTDRVEFIGESRRWLSYDLPDDLTATLWNGRYRGQTQKWFLGRFKGEDSDIDLAAHDAPEFSTWRWARIEELLRLVIPFKRQLYEDIIKEFGSRIVPESEPG